VKRGCRVRRTLKRVYRRLGLSLAYVFLCGQNLAGNTAFKMGIDRESVNSRCAEGPCATSGHRVDRRTPRMSAPLSPTNATQKRRMHVKLAAHIRVSYRLLRSVLSRLTFATSASAHQRTQTLTRSPVHPLKLQRTSQQTWLVLPLRCEHRLGAASADRDRQVATPTTMAGRARPRLGNTCTEPASLQSY
jgi:hypothetical protein